MVIDDEPSVQDVVRAYLEKDGFTVHVAGTGPDALAAAAERPPLIVLDLMLPGLAGIEVCRALRERTDVPIIMVTARTTEEDKLEGLRSARTTTSPSRSARASWWRACARCCGARRRRAPLAQSRVIELGALRIDVDRHAVTHAGQALDVTPTEFAVLEVLMEHPGHAFTRAELIEKGLGYTYDGLDRAIDSHIKNLRKKIEPDPPARPTFETVMASAIGSAQL